MYGDLDRYERWIELLPTLQNLNISNQIDLVSFEWAVLKNLQAQVILEDAGVSPVPRR